MPAKRTPKKATPAAAAADPGPSPKPAASPKQAPKRDPKPAAEPAPDATATAEAAPEGTPEAEAVEPEPVPMNRAERRAKGKVRQQPGFGPNKVVGSRGPASAQRNFANRRSG
jgi:hypothetical protein